MSEEPKILGSVRRRAVRAAMALMLVACAVPVAGQELAPTRSEVKGRVLDASTRTPLAGAIVVLEGQPPGTIVDARGASAFRTMALTDETGVEGAYRFEGLASGVYVIRVVRLGYRPARVEIELRGAATSRVTLGLVIEPIALDPLEVTVAERPMMVRAPTTSEVDAQRIGNVELRQQQFLEFDVRVVGHTDLLEAVTLGETDIFRALQRLPGVSTRDDFTSQMWTRGAPWGHTRVYFDGVPLFNPVHMGGMLSGVSPDAVGSVFFHPGVRPVSVGEGAAGVVNLASRRARDQGSNPVRAEAALTGLRAATETRFWGGRGGLVASARRSWWDWATNAVAAPDGVPGPDEVVDYALVSWSGVFDYSWGEHNHVEVSTLFEEDQLDGGIPGGIYGNFGRWGNKADRVSLDTRVANVPVRFTFGESRYRADIWDDPSPSPPRNPLDEDVVTLDPAMGRLGYTFLRGELVGEREGGRPARWTVGLEITEQFSRQSGAALPPHAVGEARRILEGQQLQYGVLFADYRLEPRPDLTIQAGVRWETGSQVVNGGQDRMAPRLSLRFRVNPRVSISAAYGRSYQYAQPIGEAGKPFGQQWHYAHTWLLAGTQSPVLRSDVGTLGVERWLGGTWLASTTGYIRHATGVAMEDPRPGSVFPVGWPGVEPRSAWVEGTNTAFGLEMGIRRLAGRVTGSAAYSLGVSNFKGGQLDFASPADRRHVLDATLMTRARDNLLLGAAFTAASGAPFTRTFNDYCHDWPDASGNCPAPATGPIPFRGPPNAERGPTYASLDLLVDWTSERLGWSWGAYLQLRNVLGRDNKGVFIETTCSADSYIGGGCSSPELQRDSFEGGISFPLPLIGFRLAF